MNGLTAVTRSAKERRSRLYGSRVPWRIWRFRRAAIALSFFNHSRVTNCYNLWDNYFKTFLIVFRRIYTVIHRLFKICLFNGFVKLTKAVTFLFVICQILSLMTNWRSASASPAWGNRAASASVYFNGQRTAIVTSGAGHHGWLAQTHRIAIRRCVCVGRVCVCARVRMGVSARMCVR